MEKLTEAMKKLKCGNGQDKNVTQGPLINEKAVEKVLFYIHILSFIFRLNNWWITL